MHAFLVISARRKCEMGTRGSHLQYKKDLFFFWLILPAPHTLPFTSEKLDSRLEEIASLFSKTENNLKPLFVGELSDI